MVIVTLVTALSVVVQSQAQTQTASPLPRFEDYPVTEIFRGIPAAPQLVTATERMYRTVIRNGVSKGFGVMRDGKEQPGPNFAGHYMAVEWACGSPCGMMAIVDAVTGKIYSPPISDGFLLPSLPTAVPGDPDHFMPWVAKVEFRPNSNLMIVKANPDLSKGRRNYTHYFLWKHNRWNLLRQIPLEDTTP
jgi:hypothetical protein